MSQSNQQGGFRQWLASQGGNLRQQFALPRDPDGSVSYAQLFGRGIGSALGGSAFGPFGGAALGRFGQNIGQRVSYMFDNDDNPVVVSWTSSAETVENSTQDRPLYKSQGIVGNPQVRLIRLQQRIMLEQHHKGIGVHRLLATPGT
jgi:hypothetical protein